MLLKFLAYWYSNSIGAYIIEPISHIILLTHTTIVSISHFWAEIGWHIWLHIHTCMHTCMYMCNDCELIWLYKYYCINSYNYLCYTAADLVTLSWERLPYFQSWWSQLCSSRPLQLQYWQFFHQGSSSANMVVTCMVSVLLRLQQRWNIILRYWE